ncbi:MAG: TonB-dependent receptor domain-containing protein [Ramlibacter sp.]
MASTKLFPRAGVPLAIAFLTPAAFAQLALPEVVVSASRTEQRVQDALPSTTVLTRQDIEAAQTPDLPTLLQRVAGLEITQVGGPGTVATASLRGAEARHTLVLVDGVPINNLNFGLPALEHLSLADVERIEVVRGNVSSLYGSAALGGVIQIITRQPTGTPTASVTVQGGSRGMVQGSATGAVRLASGTGLRASVEALRDRGFDATDHVELPGTNPDRDGYRRRTASLGVTQDIEGGHAVGLRVRQSRGTTQYDSQFGPATQADESKFVESSAVLDGRLKLSSTLDLTAAVTQATDKLDAQVTAFPFFVESTSDGAQLGLQWKPTAGHTLTAGLEHTRQKLRSDTTYDRTSRNQDSARLGYTFTSGKHQAQLNLREDRYTTFGSATTWLAAYGYQLTDAWRVSASASTGFNAPTFNDLYFPFGGNASLRPERLRANEVAVQYAAAGHLLRATVFENRYTDLFGFDAFFNRINIGRARNRGVEFSYSGRIGDTGLSAGLTSQDPKDLDTDGQLQRRAKALVRLGVTRDNGPWQWGGAVRASGKRPDAATTLGGYALLDLTASYKLSTETKLFGRIENATDRRYETAFGYRQAGRGVFVGLTWQPRL